ncbi:MAG: cell division protein FtsA, partial [Mucilaginibacter sp.]|nr:cell division protein FtsA [Mucilaginibacter sp.]
MDKTSTHEKSSPIVVGLDIGTTKICAIVGRR